MERWKINRAGLINFWYYGDEEFDFLDGRLLLRGSNGSGKSVTMQSLIPLLLDGNKSPERLDPFGTRARKMENYLIGEDYDADERTAYLYIEYIKPQVKKYVTIGMGLRARKNKKLDSWYFLIKDGRRINIDFYLYKKMGEKITLSKKELENRLQEGGQVIDSQKEYMSKVNDLLFGYDDMESYDELIKLLISLRSPKLSKDFRPTAIYEIMTNALQTLTDDDLRPMSEAIENMDTIKSQLDVLSQCKIAVQKIKKAYDEYNVYILFNKAHKLVDYHNRKNETDNNYKNLIKSLKEKEERYKELEEIILKLEEELKKYQEQKKLLEKHDIFQIKEEILIIENNIKEFQNSIKDKNNHLETQKTAERKISDDIEKTEAVIEQIREKINEYLNEMDETADIISFDEQEFMHAELIKDLDEPYNFTYMAERTKTYKNMLKSALDVLKEEDSYKKLYDKQVFEVDRLEKDLKVHQQELKQTETYFEEIKEEYIENVYSWEEGNKYLKIDKSVLGNISNRVYGYGTESNYDDIVAPISEIYQNIYEDISNRIAKLNTEKESLDNEIDLKKSELDEWKRKKDPEPERSMEVLESRRKLDEAQIPYTPLYLAVDFNDTISEDMKGIIEEALIKMGLLDALIIPPEYEEEIMKSDAFTDKYIFADPNFLDFELSKLLNVEKDMKGSIGLELVDDILKSIFIKAKKGTFIEETGRYGIGILRGIVSKKHKPNFIGSAARRRYRQDMIKGIETQIDELNIKLEKICASIEAEKDKQEKLKREKASLPGKDDLETSLNQYKEAQQKVFSADRNFKIETNKAEELWKQWQKKRELVREKTIKINLSPNIKIYTEAVETAEEYQAQLSDLNITHNDYLQKNELLINYKERHANVTDQIEDLSGDIFTLERKMRSDSDKKADYEQQLKEKGGLDIEKQLDLCIRKLDILPKEKEEAVVEKSKTEEKIYNLKDTLDEVNKELKRVEQLRYIYEQNFIQEYELGYIQEPDDNIGIKEAKEINKTYNYLLKQSKTGNDYLQSLQEVYYKHQGLLTEYNVSFVYMFESGYIDDLNTELMEAKNMAKRLDIKVKVSGKEIFFNDFAVYLNNQYDQCESLLRERDRYLFEDLLLSTISKKIRAKINHSEQWVKQMNKLMESMNTSSGLYFSLQWRSKKAETEEQLNTSELVDILRMNPELLTDDKKEQISKHFRSKIEEAKQKMNDAEYSDTFLKLIKEVLDYRQWFEFQLQYTKKGDKKRELTNNAFYIFSGGEKAMAMYVPLFSAVYARYEGARKDCPRIISLDEAFAGVDEQNIKDMFRLLVELDLSFIINSQVLWGDCDTVPALSICDLQRPENAKFVSVIRYKWNGKMKYLLADRNELNIEDEANVS